MGTPVATFKQFHPSTSRSLSSVIDIYADRMKALVVSHRKVKGQVLHLALWYNVDDRKNLYLLEIVDGFPNGGGDPELFAVQSAGSDKFPIIRQGKLNLTLVNPVEAVTAFKESWRGTQEIRASLRRGNFIVLFQDKRGKQLLEQLR
jgi:hypothetical protein